jgi:hypothetical protein
MSNDDLVKRLRNAKSYIPEYDFHGNEINVDDEDILYKEAAEEIERLREKCDKQAMILRRLTPENFPDTYFIHGDGGTKDINGMPERVYVVPAYGCDWSQVYERTDKVTGQEW